MVRFLRVGLIALGLLVGVLSLLAGLGLTGIGDKYFTVRLVNRTSQTVVVDNHGDVVKLRPGQVDAEWGSSTASQPIQLRLGRERTCVNLYFRTAPRRPVPITVIGRHLSLSRTPSC